jgi:hypothetical protein
VRSRTLLAFALAALAAVLLAWWLQRESAPEAPGQVVLPGLAAQLNQVAALVVEPAGGEAFRLERTADGWQAPAKGGYPVDAGKVRRLLLRLAEARVLEAKTSNPEFHDRLGVDAEDGRPGSGVLLRLEGTEGVPPLLIGQRETRGLRGTYLRPADDPRALLVDQELQAERTVLDWLERDLLDIPPEEIESLEISQPDGETLGIDRDELGIFRVAELPEGYRPSGPMAAESVGRALSALRLDDVRPLEGWTQEGPPVRATVRLRDGVVIEARTWSLAGETKVEERWSAFSAFHETGEHGTPPSQAAIDRVSSLNVRLEPWLFKLPAWKHEQLTRRRGDLLIPADD